MPTISKKRKFVADGVFYAELNALFERELGPCGYSGVEVRVTPVRTEIIIRATKTLEVVGEKGVRIRQLTSLVQKRWKLSKVELYAERVPNRALCAVAQAESLKFKLDVGLAVRRACYGVLRFIMENGAKGVEIVISGKLRGQRAKAMKFRDGYMIKSGNAVNHYVDSAVRSILLKQGVLGIRVTIMLGYDEKGKAGPSVSLSDVWSIREPAKEEEQTQSKQGGFQKQQREQREQQPQQLTTDGATATAGATTTTTTLSTTGAVAQPTPQSPQQLAADAQQQQQQSMMVQQALGSDPQASQSLPQQTMAQQVSPLDAPYLP